jgi:virginiamycin B lyase
VPAAFIAAAACGNRPLVPRAALDGGAPCGATVCSITELCEEGRCKSRITETAVAVAPGHSPGPWDIAAGPDGNLWFTITDGHVARMTTEGSVTTFPLPPERYMVMPFSISGGRDAVWFTTTDPAAGLAGRATLDGTITLFHLPADVHGSWGVAALVDGSAWITEAPVARIGRITRDGTVTEIPLAAGANARGIVPGADGGLWFTEDLAPGRIGRIGPAGAVTEISIGAGYPLQIDADSDGGVWFTEGGCGTPAGIGHVSAAGEVIDFPLPADAEPPADLAVGPDGSVWFTQFEGNRIGRLTPTGEITWFPIATPRAEPHFITAGPDGNLWFTEYSSIGRLVPP